MKRKSFADFWRFAGRWQALAFVLALVYGADSLARWLFPEYPVARTVLMMTLAIGGGHAYGRYRARRHTGSDHD